MDFEDWFKNYKIEPGLAGINKSFVDCWNASAEAHKPRWIPVSERLPKNHGRYAVLVPGYKDCIIDYFNGSFLPFASHWAELPELPEDK